MPICSSTSRRLQIDILGESQLIGYPTQYPSVSMMDWTKNQPNARYWVLKLIKDSFHPGDKLVETSVGFEGRGGAGICHTRRPQAFAGKQEQPRDRGFPAGCRQGHSTDSG